MRKLLPVAFAILAFVPAPCKAQAPPQDAQALQPLLEEVRRLRHDLQTTAATVQRMQILLYRIRSQMEVVARVNELHERAQATLMQTRRQHDQVVAQIKEEEESFNRSNDSNARESIKEGVERLKDWLEQLTQAEPDAQAKESESANDLRLEQGKLAELEEQLDRLDKKLESDASASDRKPPKNS
jgi:hypothetical protein